MHQADLDFSTQLTLTSLIIVVSVAFLIRAAVFFQGERAGIPPTYPDSWNLGQRHALEGLRLLIGLALIPLWALFLIIRPSMPTNWPFGYLEAISFISMLSVSYAWTVLLATRNWKRLDAFPRSFVLTITFLVLWWGTAFTAIGWVFAEVSAPPPFRIFPPGIYPEQEIPRLTRTAGHYLPGPSITK
jgi:hypothetical protein